MTQDPQWGPTIVVGLGGILVEVLKDIATRIAPVRRCDAEEMLRELKGGKILSAFRGQAAADIDAVIETVMRFSQLCLDLKEEIHEIDINPLLVFARGKGVKVVDCLIKRRVGTN
jgi:acetyltransferase